MLYVNNYTGRWQEIWFDKNETNMRYTRVCTQTLNQLSLFELNFYWWGFFSYYFQNLIIWLKSSLIGNIYATLPLLWVLLSIIISVYSHCSFFHCPLCYSKPLSLFTSPHVQALSSLYPSATLSGFSPLTYIPLLSPLKLSQSHPGLASLHFSPES